MGAPTGKELLASLGARWARAPALRWLPVPPELDAAIAGDEDLAAAARVAREALCDALVRRLGPLPPRHLHAVLEVPRERFVLPDDIGRSAEDVPAPLDQAGRATVSAPHAYLLTYGLLGLSEGDHLLELGTGTGYGAALAREIVGPTGRIVTIEIDRDLAVRAARLLHTPNARVAPIDVHHADGRLLAPDLMASMGGSAPRLRVAVTYALASLPEAFERALPEKGCLVAPVGATEEQQELVRLERRNSILWQSSHGAVRYVVERRAAQ